MVMSAEQKVHGLEGGSEAPDWPFLKLEEVDTVLRNYPGARGAEHIVRFSPRPFSAAAVVATPKGTVFVKRHHRSVRDREGILEEHRLIAYLHGRGALVKPALADDDGQTTMMQGKWIYEVHPLGMGIDVYVDALSWTPFQTAAHARGAGLALAHLHRAAAGYDAPRRQPRPLVAGFSIFSTDHPWPSLERYVRDRPALAAYLASRKWRQDFDELLMPLHTALRSWLPYFRPLWTHNDFHASNLLWNGGDPDATVSGIIDFGLADRTTAIYDLATAIERNAIEWLRLPDDSPDILHLDQVDALLEGYEALCPLSYEEAHGLVALLPLVHVEFALSEVEYFFGILKSSPKADLAYDGYALGHARWFQGRNGRRLLEHLAAWAEGTRARQGQREPCTETAS